MWRCCEISSSSYFLATRNCHLQRGDHDDNSSLHTFACAPCWKQCPNCREKTKTCAFRVHRIFTSRAEEGCCFFLRQLRQILGRTSIFQSRTGNSCGSRQLEVDRFETHGRQMWRTRSCWNYAAWIYTFGHFRLFFLPEKQMFLSHLCQKVTHQPVRTLYKSWPLSCDVWRLFASACCRAGKTALAGRSPSTLIAEKIHLGDPIVIHRQW